jgi:hypothetical protein
LDKDKEFDWSNGMAWYDLEGIATDGLGYTVSVSIGNAQVETNNRNMKPKGLLRFRRKKSESKRPKTSGQFELKAKTPSGSRDYLNANSGNRGDSLVSGVINEETTIEIVTRRSIHIRESFRANQSPKEEDISA